MRDDRGATNNPVKDLAQIIEQGTEIVGSMPNPMSAPDRSQTENRASPSPFSCHAEVFEIATNLLSVYGTSKTAPRRDEVTGLFARIQEVFACAPLIIECALLKKIGTSEHSSNSPDLFCTFSCVDSQRRIYAVLHDDYRDALERIVIVRDHGKKEQEEFSGTCFNLGESAEEVSALSPSNAEKLYTLIGDLHQGSERIFYKE